MRFLLVFTAFLGMVFCPAPGWSQEAGTSLVKPGQTVLNIAASERQVVQQDLLIASLRYESDNKDPKVLQNQINTLIKKALDKAKAYNEVSVSTENYYVYQYEQNPRPYPDPTPDIPRTFFWKGSQGLQLKSKNSEQLLQLTGELQEMGLQMSGLVYTLSPEVFEKVRDSLMEGALAKLTERAKRAAKALGKDSAELVEVNVDTGYPSPPMPMMMARSDMAAGSMEKMAAPVSSPGESEITLSVNARAVLK